MGRHSVKACSTGAGDTSGVLDLKSPDLLRAVTAIVDDDLQWAMPPGDDAQEVGVCLVALIGEDAFLIEEGSVAEVQSDDLSFRKEVLPHSQ